MLPFLDNIVKVPRLTPLRIVAAFAVALMVDGFQLVMGPLGWAFADEISDVFAMVVETWLLGFHPLFLPTFIVEFLPVADMLPTWTACVSAVVVLRKIKPTVRPLPPKIENQLPKNT